MQFNKPAKTFDEQLDLLIHRGLLVEDGAKALHYHRNSIIIVLKLIGYLLSQAEPLINLKNELSGIEKILNEIDIAIET